MRLAFPFWCASVVLLFGPGASTPPAQSGLRPYAQEVRIVSDENAPGMQLTSIADIITNEKGLTFTAHSQEGLIRVFDATGKLVRSFGRKGQGPGEFQDYLKFAATIGDTVVVIDGSRNLITSFGSDGKVNRVVQTRGAWTDRVIAALLLPGRQLVRISLNSKDFHPKYTSSGYAITDLTGQVIARVATDNVPQFYTTFRKPGATEVPQPFVPSVKWATDHSGTRGVVAVPYTMWNGKPGQVKLLVVNHDGIESERILSLEVRKPTNADVNAWVSSQLGIAKSLMTRTGTPASDIEQQLRDNLTMRDDLPVVAQLMMGRDGSIWTRPYWSKTDWTVFAPTGTRSFTVRVPAGARLADVTMERFWALTSDSDLLPIATRYRFAAP